MAFLVHRLGHKDFQPGGDSAALVCTGVDARVYLQPHIGAVDVKAHLVGHKAGCQLLQRSLAELGCVDVANLAGLLDHYLLLSHLRPRNAAAIEPPPKAMAAAERACAS